VRGGQDADVDLDGLGPANALERPFLKHAQKAHLQARRDVPDLVQEQGAAVGDLEPPLVRADGAGERPLFVSEQLTLEDPVGQRRAVDANERASGAAAGLVDEPRDQFFTGPRLPADDNGRVAVGSAPGQLQRSLQTPVGAHHARPAAPAAAFVGQGRPQVRLLGQQPAALRQA
jgi:hypothetical protein